MFILREKMIWILRKKDVSEISVKCFYSITLSEKALIEELPIKQGLKLTGLKTFPLKILSHRGTSNKTRIETRITRQTWN